ncbi:uncharacterized protein LOC119112632 [Pollicipes pollicipes]|nr:uncharacterized protein LOC119112632 [Pollicipes pollicipes]
MKEIFRMKQKIRRLEEKCKRLMSDPSASGPDRLPVSVDAAGSAAGDVTGCDWVNGRGHVAASGESGSSQAVTEVGDEPLVVLRDEVSPLNVIGMLREYELSDEMMAHTPSDLQEAVEVNQRLKIQNLAMLAAILDWIVKKPMEWGLKDKLTHSKKCAEQVVKANSTQTTPRRCFEQVVKRKRLKELLHLEKSIQGIFTEAQIKGITRDFSARIQEKRRKVVLWSEEDMRRTMELRSIGSEDVLNHVRWRMKIPLPSMETVKWRCRKSPELNAMYRSMLTKGNEGPHCGLCQRALGAVDDVAGTMLERPSDVARSPLNSADLSGTSRQCRLPFTEEAKRGGDASVLKIRYPPRKRARERSEDSESPDSDEDGYGDPGEAAFGLSARPRECEQSMPTVLSHSTGVRNQSRKCYL